MPRRADTRNDILELARTHLVQQGFHGFSYRHLADALGVKTAAIHYHFRTKTDLGVELVSGVHAEFRSWVAAVEAATDSPLSRLDGFFAWHHTFVDNPNGSPLVALEVEYGTLPQPMQDGVRHVASDVHAWLARTLRHGVDCAELEFDGDPDQQALVVAAAVQGGLLIGRAFGADRYDAVITQLRRQLTK